MTDSFLVMSLPNWSVYFLPTTSEVQVVGIVPANINLNFSIDPTSTAVIGTDYKIKNGVSTSFNIPLAAGDYSSGYTISIPVQLLNNSVVEGSRFFKVILTPDATKFTIMPTNSCTNTGGNATSTYSIQDDDIGLQLEKTWVNASVNDKATLTTTGGASGASNINYVSTATAANVSNASNAIILAAGASRTLAETLSSSNTGAYNASVWSCDGGSLSGSVLTTSTADYGKVIKCTVTNSRITSLQLAKVWGANSLSTDSATIGATTGASNNTTAFSTPGGTNANSGAPVAITVGNTITFPAEAGTNIANYNTVLSCTANGGATVNALSGTNGQASNTLVIAAGDAGKSIVCSYTNTRKSTTFRLAKAWAANSLTGNVANIGATTGLTNNTAAFTSTASTATNGTAVTVYAGETATLPAETMSSGTLSNYNTVISCNAGTLTGTNGQSTGNTLAITATATTTNPITCTYTNTVTGADLAIDKTGSSSVTQGSTVSYTIKVWNKGPTAVSDAVMNDVVPNNISGVSLQCTATGSATCGTVTPYVSGSNTRTATGISLPVDATGNTNFATYTVKGLAYSTGSFTNTATVSSATIAESNNADNSASQATTITTDTPVTTGNAANKCLAAAATNVITPTVFTVLDADGRTASSTGTLTATVNSTGTGYGTATNGAIVLNGKMSWSYGSPIKAGSTLTFRVNGIDVAVLTTPGASSNGSASATAGDKATFTGLNGATVSQATYNIDNTYTTYSGRANFTVTLPTTITSISSAQAVYLTLNPLSPTGVTGDDFGVSIDSALQCLKPIVKIAKTSNGGTGTFNFNTLTNLNNSTGTAVTTDTVTTATAGIAVTSAQTNYATALNTAVNITEAAATDYGLTAASCTDSNSAVTGNTGSFGSLSGTTLSIPAANIKYGANLTCTFNNTKQRTLTLRKTWVNARVNDAATITATGLNSFASIASTANETDTAAAQAVNVGSTVTLGENISTGVGLYNAALSCTRNSDGAAVSVTGTNLTMPDADVTCTYTNTRKSATLTLSKIWSAGSIAGNTVTVTSTGFINNASSGTSTATAAGNTKTGTGVTVYAGETGTISETFGTGNASNYTANLTCSGNSTALTGNSLTINPADTAITCSYTNTVTGADLAINKTGSTNVTQGDNVSYSIKVWNKGPNPATSSTFTDNVPAALTNVTWSCSASGTAVCGTTSSGSGNTINVMTGALPVNSATGVPISGDYLTFTVTGTATTVGSIINTASIAVTSGTDPVTTNNNSSTSTTVNAPAAITPNTPQKEARFSITPDLPTIYRGQAGTQLVTIKNEGPDDASGTVATFKPRTQTGVTVTSVKIVNGANCSLSSGEWSCPVGSVANGGSFQLQVGYDTTASSTLGTAIQADIRVGSNEFNPGSGVGESLYNVWGSTNPNGSSQFNEIRPNGAFALGYGTANANENVNLSTAWLPTQVNPTGAYLTQAAIGGNNSVFGPSGTYSPTISRIITSLNTDTAKSQTLLALNPATQAGDNRRVWQLTTGIYVPANSTASLCIGNAGSQLDDGAYIMLNAAQVGVDGKWSSNPYIQNSVTLNTGYNRITYRIANRNTPGRNEDYAQGLYGEIGLSLNGGACTAANLDATARLQIPASINIVEKQVVSISGQVFEDNGSSTGISNAYDGTKQAGELGIAGSTVTINNCTNTTAIATTQTNANGEYTFSLLPTDLPADNFCIAQQNLDGYSSVSGTAGYTRATDTITVPKTPAVVTYPDHNFGDARLNAVLTEDGQQTIIAGGVADYPHRLTAQSVLTVTSINQTSTQQPANATDAPWQSLLYLDTDCNGKVDAGENLISASLQLSLEANEQVCLVQRVYAPANASMGAQHIGQLQASFNVSLANPTETITGTSIQRQDTTLLGSAGLSMQKMVRSVESCPSTAEDTGAFATTNTAQSGGYLEYEITYRNNSLKNLIDISIKDTVPVGTVFKNINCQVSPAGTCTESKTGDALLWQTSGTLLPNQQGKVRFCVQIP